MYVDLSNKLIAAVNCTAALQADQWILPHIPDLLNFDVIYRFVGTTLHSALSRHLMQFVILL